MFWSNLSFFQTVRFKLALLYTFLFGVSLLVCFTAIYLYQTQHIYDDVDLRLTNFKNDFTYEYLTGLERNKTEVFISSDAIPSEVLSKLKKTSPNFQLLFATMDHGDILTAYGLENGEPVAFADASSYPQLRRRSFAEDRFKQIKHKYDRFLPIPNIDIIHLWVLDPSFNVLVKTDSGIRNVPGMTDAERKYLAKNDLWGEYKNNNARMRFFKHLLFDGNVLIVAYDMDELKHSHTRLLSVFIIGLLCMLVVGVVTSLLLAGKFIGGLVRVTRAAREIESGDFSKRVSHGKEGLELDNLIDAFNDMTENTENLFRELRTISDDIAHDLRTPLTRMSGQAELAMISGKQEKLAGIVAEECSQMLIMINTMLDITQTECKVNRAQFESVDICEISRSMIELFSSIAEDKGIALNTEIPNDRVIISGMKIKLQQLCVNLLDNAIKFTPPGGSVLFTVKRLKHGVLLQIQDSGCGIPEKDQMHIFDRFYRSDASRTLPGNGLGLSLVRAIVSAHNGNIKLCSQEGEGSTFNVFLPF